MVDVSGISLNIGERGGFEGRVELVSLELICLVGWLTELRVVMSRKA